ncbi:MAG: hypothetical protein ACI9WU_002324 [Myxococcota bacterium]|jgi:hypothetical protein
MPRPKSPEVVTIDPPSPDQRAIRGARFAAPGEKKTRYSLPTGLDSASVVGYRTRVALTRVEAEGLMPLLSLERPTAFGAPEAPTEAELFEECALGVLSSRQSTNYRGFRQVTFGPDQRDKINGILQGIEGRETGVLPDSSYVHVVVGMPYRTPFTLLLTLAGHKPFLNMITVPIRALRKRFQYVDDIPTIGYLPHLHTGILAEGMERAAVIASGGKRRANAFMQPFSGAYRARNGGAAKRLEKMCGLTAAERSLGWRVQLVVQVGTGIEGEALALDPVACRKLGANLLSFRSERIQPGVNQEESAPDAYQNRQDMDVPDDLTIQAGRAGYNAFAHWTGTSRERAKELLLLDRIDVLTPNGKERLRAIRKHLGQVTDYLIRDMPLWADLPTGRAFSKNANRGRKAFALAGQRIYIAGLDRQKIESEGLDFTHAVRAVGAAAARTSLYCELMGCVELPEECDLLAGVCLMAGPVNQNDIGKQFYGSPDLLKHAFHTADPTSLLVWTLKAKTVADPIGNEEQLMNAARKGALVDLRPAPHEVVKVARAGKLAGLRFDAGRPNTERAFGDVGNFVTAPDGAPIPGNEGEPLSEAARSRPVW